MNTETVTKQKNFEVEYHSTTGNTILQHLSIKFPVILLAVNKKKKRRGFILRFDTLGCNFWVSGILGFC